METKTVICRGLADTIAAAVEPWKADHEKALRVRDIEDVVALCLHLHHHLHEWQRQAWEYAFSGEMRDPQTTGETLRSALEIGLQSCEMVRQAVGWANAKGYQVDQATDLHQAAEDLTKLQKDLLQRWPFFDAAEIKRELENGEESLPLESLLDG